MEKNKRATKPKMERRMQERHDRDGSERGQDNKQGSMEEYHHTGQAREEEDYKLASSSWKCAVYKLNPKQVIIRRINYVLD